MLDPEITRRDFLKAASLLAVPVAFRGAANAAAVAVPPAGYAFAYVGTYTPLPTKFSGSNLSSEILITADGRFEPVGSPAAMVMLEHS